MIQAGSDILASDLVHMRKLILTAAENLTAGDRVGISNMLNGYCARAKTVSRSLTITPNVEDTGVFPKTIVIGTDKYLLVYREDGTSNLKAVVATVNRSNMASPFTFGTVVTITTTQVTAAIYTDVLFDVCQLDTDKFAVAYNESGATTITRLVIATVSGTTITLGTAVNYDSSANAVQGVAIGQISTNKAVVAIGKTTNYRTLCFTASGTVATIGASAALHANLNGTNLRVVVVATDKFCVSNDNAGYMQCGTISGTTITLGTNVQYDSSATADVNTHALWSPASNVICVSYLRGGSKNFICATISGTTLTFGSRLDSGNTASGNVLNVSASVFYSTSANGGVSQYGISGTTLTLTKVLAQQVHGGGARGGFMNFGTYWILLNHGLTTVTYFIQGMSNNFIGIAQSTVSKDATVEVIIAGIDSKQSGLSAGMKYLVDTGGALTQIIDNNTVNTLDDADVVLAINATEIKL